MSGITIGAFQSVYGKNKTCEDLKKLTYAQWVAIFHRLFWNPLRAYDIASTSVCMLIVDMAFMSGIKTTVKKVQEIVGADVDGIVGKQTITYINCYDPATLFNDLKEMRTLWLEKIAKKGNNKKFLKGWMNRLNSIQFEG